MADALDFPGRAQGAKGGAEIIGPLEEPKIAVFSLQYALGSRDIVLRQGHSNDYAFSVEAGLHGVDRGTFVVRLQGATDLTVHGAHGSGGGPRSQPMTLATRCCGSKSATDPGPKNRIRAREDMPIRVEVSTPTVTAVEQRFPRHTALGLGDRQGCWQGRGKGCTTARSCTQSNSRLCIMTLLAIAAQGAGSLPP